MAGVVPLGLQPLRRTIIVFDALPDQEIGDWPFTKTAIDDFTCCRGKKKKKKKKKPFQSGRLVGLPRR